MKRNLSNGVGVGFGLTALLLLGTGLLAGCSGAEDCSASRTCAPSAPDETPDPGAGGTAGATGGAGGLGGAAGGGGTSSGTAGSGGAAPAAGGSAGEPGGAGAAGEGEPEPPSDMTAPFVESIVPADGASGVSADAPVVITFSEPMDRAVAESAIVATDIAAPAYSWDETGKVLTIAHTTPFEYATGTDPNTLTAKSYNVTISRGATDLAGNRLVDAAATTFTTLRRLRYVSAPLADEFGRAVTVVSNGGGAVGCVGQSWLMIGETSETVYLKLFTSFGMSQLPPGIVAFERASLTTAELLGVAGAPYGSQSLGVLVAERVQYAALGVTALEMPGLGSPYMLADARRTTGRLEADVETDLAAAYAAGESALQLRIGFTNGLSANGQIDGVMMSCSSPFGIDVTYLVP